MTAAPSPLLVTRRGPVAVLTLNRPEVRNAVDQRLGNALDRALTENEADPAVRAIVLTGAGGTFCAGADLDSLARGEAPALIEGRGFAGLTERTRRRPLIAAVEGAAVAGGFELALACDLIVASQQAVFALPEVRLGLVAAAGGAVRLTQDIPPRVAMELLLTGEELDAQRAKELGIVNRVVPAGAVLSAAIDLAVGIAAHPRAAVDAARSIVVASRDDGAACGWEASTRARESMLESADAKASLGARAHRRHREPE